MSGPSPVDVVRINSRTYGWNSCTFSVDAMPTEGLVGMDYDEKLEVRVIYSNQQDGPPLGQTAGRYQVGRFPLRMLRDSARAFKLYLTSRALLVPSGSYGQALFSMGIQLSGKDAGDLLPSTTIFSSCRVVGEKNTTEEGTGALVTEFDVGCLLILQDGVSLWNSTAGTIPVGVGATFPVADTITVGGLPAPGKWSLERADKVYGWQERQGFGLTGATTVPKGDPLVHVSFLVEFWDPVDFIAFKAFRTLYLKKALVSVGGLVTATIGIDHPELQELGVSSVVVEKITPVLNDGYGVWSCKIDFLQYRKPAPALSKPSMNVPDNGAPKVAASTQTQVAIQQALAILQGLPKAPP